MDNPSFRILGSAVAEGVPAYFRNCRVCRARRTRNPRAHILQLLGRQPQEEMHSTNSSVTRIRKKSSMRAFEQP